jgi:putative PIN family toxin of toxin-antitoxin system
MVIVVDTNVFVGACLGSKASAAVIASCLQQKLFPLMGTALLMEYEDVLGRDEIFLKSHLSREERAELLDIFLSTCQWTRIYFGWRPNLPDEGDNHLIELAVAGGATRIVTHNLRDWRSREIRFDNLLVVTPEQLLQEIAP